MASIEKYRAGAIGRLFLHNNRTQGDGVTHDNKEIDNLRTNQNYHLKHGSAADVRNRLREVYRRGRPDEVVLAEVVVSLPKDVKPEDEKKFFSLCYGFYADDFGEVNIVNAVVHKDETTPHLHLDFVPVVDKEIEYKETSPYAEDLRQFQETHKTTERLCAADLLTREYLQNMHPRLYLYVAKGLGYEVEILNGATASGNKTVLELKNKVLEENIGKNHIVLENMEKEILQLVNLSRKCGFEPNDVSFIPLLEQIQALQIQNSILQDIIRKNGFSYSRDQLIALKQSQVSNVKSSFLSVKSGSMANFEIDSKGIIVIEVQQTEDKVYTPQRPLFDSEPGGRFDIERQFRRFLASREPVWIQASRKTDNLYLFVKANDIPMILENLQRMLELLEQDEYRGRKIYMEQFENDKYHFAKNVLEQTNHYVQYFVRTNKVSKEKQTEKEI